MNQLFASKNKRLRTACFGGSLDTVKALLVDGADLNRGGRFGQTPLHHACRGGHEKIVEYLLNKGADPNVKELNGDTPLHFACRSGSLGIVQRLKAGGAKPGIVNMAKENALDVAGKSTALGSDECYEFLNADNPTEQLAVRIIAEKQARGNLKPGQEPEGPVLLELDKFEEIVMEGAQMKRGLGDDERTLLHMACAAGVLDFVRLLVSQGSDIHQRTTGGKQALHYSSDFGHYAVSQFLIAQGADVNARSDEGFTPFLGACTEDKPQTVELLLKSGANLRHTSCDGRTGLHVAAAFGCKAVVSLLLSKGLDPKAKCKKDLSVFDYAAASGHTEILRMLTEHSDSPISPDGVTLLMLADDAETASLLLKKGADVHQKSATGRTALHYAAQKGKADVMRLLIEHGANVNEQENDGYVPLHYAARENKAECVSILLSSGASPYAVEQLAHAMPYHHAASSGSSDALKVFIDNRVDLEKTCSSDSQRALHLAAKNNHYECTRLLLEARVETDAQDDDGWTACFYVCKAGHEKILELLLTHDCNTHAESKGTKKSALLVACAEGHMSIVKMLLAYGAKVNSKDAEDWTPLHFAARDSNMELAESLLGAGANKNLIDDQGRTPEKLARENSNGKEVADFLANYTVPAPTSGCFFDACAKIADNPPTPLKFLSQLEELTQLIGNVHEAKVFYTIIGGCIRGGLISKEDASFLVKPALGTTSTTCTSDQAYAIFKSILRKAKSDSFISKQESDCLEARAVSAFIEGQPFIRHIWEEIGKSSNRISLIEGSVEGLQRKVASMQQSLKVLAQQQMYMSDYLRHKQHIEIVVGMVGAVASAVSMGVGGCLVSAVSHIVDEIVDFGDLGHIQAVLLDSSETNPDVSVQFRGALSILEDTMVNRLEQNLASKLADGNILTRIALVAAAHQQGLGQTPLLSSAPLIPPPPCPPSCPSPPLVISISAASESSSACESEDHSAPMPCPVTPGGNSPLPVEEKSVCWADAVFDENETDHPVHSAVKYGFLDDILLAVRAHPDKLNTKDSKGRSPLDLAALSGQSEVFRALKEKGAVCDYPSKMKYCMKRREGRSCLFLDRVRSELKQNFQPLVLSDEDCERLPLHAAIYYADEEDIVEVLNEHRDELNCVDSEGRSAVDIAALTGQPSIVAMLEEIGGCTFGFFDGRWMMRAVSQVQDLRAHLTFLCQAQSSKNFP